MEHILQYVLPSLLGDFVQGIDKNNMKTEFFSGKVSITGITINPALLKSLDAPIKITFSDVGKLEAKIPWMKKFKEPTEIYLEDLLVLLEPLESLEDFDIIEERIKFLDKLKEECAAKLKSIDKDSSKQDEGSMSQYKGLIVDNLMVILNE